MPVAQHQLTVGADIDDQLVFFMLVWLFGQQHTNIVGAHKSGLNRQHEHVRGGIDLDTQIPGLDVQTVMKHRRKRRHAHILRI